MVEVQLDLIVLDVASGPLAAFPGTFKFEEADSDEDSDTNNLSEEQKKKLQPKLPNRVLLSCFSATYSSRLGGNRGQVQWDVFALQLWTMFMSLKINKWVLMYLGPCLHRV